MTSAPGSAPVKARFASRGSTHFDILLAMFCVVLVVSNIVATKPIEVGAGSLTLGPIQFWPLLLDGGAVLFPMAYVIGDVMSEVYGFAAARRAILVGFTASAVAVVTFTLVAAVPAASFYEHQSDFEAVLGPVTRIVLASMLGYMSGQFVNAWVLVRLKERTGEAGLFGRLIGSTGAGETVDTFIFCALAAPVIGIATFGGFLNYFVVGVIFKVLVELAVMPITVQVIAFLKRREPTYWAETEPVEPAR